MEKTLQDGHTRPPATSLLKNLHASQEATVRTRHGTTGCFKTGKGVLKAEYCHPAYLTFMQIIM